MKPNLAGSAVRAEFSARAVPARSGSAPANAPENPRTQALMSSLRPGRSRSALVAAPPLCGHRGSVRLSVVATVLAQLSRSAGQAPFPPVSIRG